MCMTQIFFIDLLGRTFKIMKKDVYFIVIAFLVAEYSRYWMTCDVTRLTRNDTKSQNIEHLRKYGVTIAIYSLPGLFLTKMKNALLVAPETVRLVLCLFLCCVMSRLAHTHQMNMKSK